MAQEIINVIFDTVTGQMRVGGLNVTTQEEKDHMVKLLLSAANLITDFKPSVIKPATVMPPMADAKTLNGGNGKVKLTN